MEFTRLEELPRSREMLSTFYGYNANVAIQSGEFEAMENLTSDCFPVLSPRKPRGVYARVQDCRGLIARDNLCWVEGSRFVLNGYPIELGLNGEPKQLVSMGAYVVIFPDKKYINTLDVTDYGSMEAEVTCTGVSLTPADAEGNALNPAFIQPEAPVSAQNMALWLDTSQKPPALMQWSAGAGMWVSAGQSYVRLSAPNIGAAFSAGDGVTITGLPEALGSRTVLTRTGVDYVLMPGILEQETVLPGPVTLCRRVPVMDLVTECGNRLWGCRYGPSDTGEIVNEIYASKLGDFKNWRCYQGISTDSYAVSLGADGPFTGAVQHLGYPVFFRENCLHKIYGSSPSNFRLQTTPCRGVQRGSGNSLAIVGETLFYKSPGGICAYDGSLPVEVSGKLGQERYSGAAAGSLGNKYYISMADSWGAYHLFVYDAARNLWHREDDTRAVCFCTCRQELYFLDGDGVIRSVCGTGEPEGDVTWMAETGDLGTESPDAQYLTRLNLRLQQEAGTQIKILVLYDSDSTPRLAACITGNTRRTVTLPLPVRRCSRLRLRLEGTGEGKLLDITKTIERGSDVF